MSIYFDAEGLPEPKHGALGTGNYSHARWCRVHRHWHGTCYPCEHYSDELLSEIAAIDRRIRTNLRTIVFCGDSDVPPDVARIFLAMLSEEENDDD